MTVSYTKIGVPYLVKSSGVAVPLTGTTAETALATIPIPAGAMGKNGVIRVTALFSYTSSASSKTLRVRLGGIAGTAFHAVVATTSSFHQTMVMIRNRNSVSSQISAPAISATAFNTGSATVVTDSINTDSAQDLVISGQLADGADSIVLQSYFVEVIYSA